MSFKDNLKYMLRNSWDILPGINEFQLIKNARKIGKILSSNSEEKIPSSFKEIGRVFLASFYLTWGISSLLSNSLNPNEWKMQSEKRYEIVQEQIRYEKKIDSIYQTIFDNSKTLEDSLEIYQKYGLPVKLEKPSFNIKERIAKSLENQLID